jgi:hypothetical protein
MPLSRWSASVAMTCEPAHDYAHAQYPLFGKGVRHLGLGWELRLGQVPEAM